MYKRVFKRLIDIVLSLIGIVVLAIPMLIIAIMIKIDSHGPVLFKQKRVGIHKGYFTILKFRSMPISAPHDTPTHQFDANGNTLSKFQTRLRQYSLDELPQLFCILSGKMSIIGPRPALWNQYDLIAERDQYGANDIRPGLSGWAQINGRDTIEIEDKARLDGEYAANVTFKMDWKCFWGTVVKVLSHEGVAEGGPCVIGKENAKK